MKIKPVSGGPKHLDHIIMITHYDNSEKDLDFYLDGFG